MVQQPVEDGEDLVAEDLTPLAGALRQRRPLRSHQRVILARALMIAGRSLGSAPRVAHMSMMILPTMGTLTATASQGPASDHQAAHPRQRAERAGQHPSRAHLLPTPH